MFYIQKTLFDDKRSHPVSIFLRFQRPFDIINILPISWGCYGRLPQEENISPETKSRVIFFPSVVIYRNTLNQRQYVLYYTECPFFNNTLKHFSNITLKLMNNSDIY